MTFDVSSFVAKGVIGFVRIGRVARARTRERKRKHKKETAFSGSETAGRVFELTEICY